MSTKKNIESLFKDNESKLAQQPSPMAWRKLEHKLDKHRSRSRMHVVRLMAMAASLLLLVASIIAFSSLLSTDKQDTAAVVSPPKMEELVDIGEARPILTKIDYQKEIQSGRQPIINEGPKGKRFIAGKGHEKRRNRKDSLGVNG